MEMPAGIDVAGVTEGRNIFVLKKSLYGLKQASYNWFEKLKTALQDRGFKSSDIDPCVFISDDMIILVYVDDCILLAKEDAKINAFIESLAEKDVHGNAEFEFTDEGPLKNYLGIEFSKREDGTMEMKQAFLIQRVIDALGFDKDHMNAKENPAVKPILHKDELGPPRKHEWHYRSVIGMLNYLEKTTRAELAFAVHQCARFCENPRLSHEKAVHKIVRYLKSTKNMGMIFKPDVSKGIECYVDADFAGDWNSMDASNPANVLSRTDYVIMYCRCTLV